MKRLNLLLPISLLAIFIVVSYSCESTEEGDTCDTIDEECFEEVTICTSDTESYYTYNGNDYYCETIDDCSQALTDLSEDLSCSSEVASASMLQVKARTQELIAEMRARL